jgi:hypothetical protein
MEEREEPKEARTEKRLLVHDDAVLNAVGIGWCFVESMGLI